MEELWEELIKQNNVRENLSKLRMQLKELQNYAQTELFVQENEQTFFAFLSNEDAKTRKNAALLLGDLEYQNATPLLFASYEKEETLFVRGAYLQALGKLDATAYLPALETQLMRLTAQPVTEETKKHVDEEIRAIRKILIDYQGIEKHSFSMKEKNHQVLLTTNSLQRRLVCSRFEQAKVHPLGVLVHTDNLGKLFQVRSFRDVLFIKEEDIFVSADPVEAAKGVLVWMQEMCDKYHVSGKKNYYRVECKSKMTLEQRSTWTKRFSAELERLSEGRLVNSASEYEIELRLIENKQGEFFPCLKFYTLEDRRFTYRKHAISSSIHPAMAGLIMELAEPYLKENAQVLDPFCGVGTMLIERAKKVPAKNLYATDIFADAIGFGRENAKLAGVPVNFIHRDFFDFKHEYLFDEIVTNMPVRGKKTKEEVDELYARFFAKASTHMKDKGILFMYTNEIAFVKKQLRMHKEYRLLQESLIQKKNDFWLLIIEVKG